jgi:hypothetical protein
LIRGDECNNHSKDSDDKDKVRLQCIILYKNLQNAGVMGNIVIQRKILQHIIQNIKIEISCIFHGGLRPKSNEEQIKAIQGSGFLGYKDLSNLNYCIKQDLQQFEEAIDIEWAYCNKIKHAFDLNKFIYMSKPMVCLNFDQAKGF